MNITGIFACSWFKEGFCFVLLFGLTWFVVLLIDPWVKTIKGSVCQIFHSFDVSGESCQVFFRGD